MTAPRRLDAEQVKALLTSQSADLLALLLPGGRTVGGEYRARGPDGSTWAVQVTGSKAGAWISGSAGLAGRSYLSLIRDIACEGDHLRAYKFALRFVGEDVTVPLPRTLPRAVPRPADADPRDNGLGIYLHGEPFDWTNPVGLYLQNRGIDPALFERPIRVLRYHRTLHNAESGRLLPGMLAAIVDPQTSKQIALHRTWLDGPPWRKAAVRTPKKVWGPFGGGLIPLTRGHSGKPWKQAPDGDCLLLAEGIENALAVAGDEPDYRCAAYVSANNLVQLRLPDAFRTICLVIDRDGENWSVTEDREIALEQWRLEGRSVGLWEPPEGVKDAADYVKEYS